MATKQVVGGEERTNREVIDRLVSENRNFSDEERMQAYREQHYDAVLPKLPEIPGYHTCWLTTTNPRDSIMNRIRIGYEPVTPADVPGVDFYSIKTGEWAGFVGVNEMLLFKIPLSLYNKMRYETQYLAPKREEEKLLSMTDLIRDRARSQGSDVYEGDGLIEMRERNSRMGTFS